MKKRYIIGLIICCLMILPLVGCTTKKATTTGTTQTPLQSLSARVNSSDAVNTRQDQNITDLSNRITTEIGAISHYNDAPILARVGVLESLNMSTFAGDLSFLTVRVSSLESYNISVRLAALEARPIYNPNISPTATPVSNGSTPTPTPIPTVAPNCSLVTKPVAIDPLNGNMSVANNSIMFQWSNCNATYYELYFGNNSNTMSLIANTTDIPMFWKDSEINPNTYYFWKVIAVSSCGNKSSSWWFKTQ
jgi:outer membrane lipoprotein-sorting protein